MFFHIWIIFTMSLLKSGLEQVKTNCTSSAPLTPVSNNKVAAQGPGPAAHGLSPGHKTDNTQALLQIFEPGLHPVLGSPVTCCKKRPGWSPAL